MSNPLSSPQAVAERGASSSLSLRGFPWYWVPVGYVAFVAVMVGFAYLWVWIYSTLIHTGEAHAFYEAYAQVASPVVALVTGMPVFYLGCRWIGSRAPQHAVAVAIGIVLVHFALEVAMVLSLPAEQAGYLAKMMIVGEPTKALAAWLGARAAAARQNGD